MKKVLAVLLCMVMCFGSVSALAYYDYPDVNEEYVKVTDLLYDLEIMEGDDEGNFNPDDTLTRAEAAAIMVRLTGQEDDVEQGETSFCDVAESHWASGYINVAEENGIINGMGDGTFDPEGLVTYHQVVKMLVCVLGYGPVAERNGGFAEGGYLYAGSKQITNVVKGVEGWISEKRYNDPITRITAAKMVYNSLDADLMDENAFSTGINGMINCFPDYDDNKTLLSEKLNCELIIGTVKCLDEQKIEITWEKNSKTYKKGEVLVLENAYRNIDELNGKKIMAWIKLGEEENVFLIGAVEKYL